jgi:hypothetical protein
MKSDIDIVNEMVRWFLNNYADPVDYLPYDSAEGGYMWELADGPYDALEVMSEEFPQYPRKLIEAAANRVNNYCIEWIKKPY